MKKNYDVIVVGGGMVGSAFALLLAKQTDLKIALVEANMPETVAVDDAPLQRVSAINPASQQILTEIHVWQHLFTSRLGPFETMQVWETPHSNLQFSAADIGIDYLAILLKISLFNNRPLRLLESIRKLNSFAPKNRSIISLARLLLKMARFSPQN